jgi:DNA polymerase III epsilon subunit-like protein
MSLIIDVETTGLPQCEGLPYGENPSYEELHMYDSARVVQVSMMLCNEHFEQVEFKDFIIKSDGFITNEISTTKGIPFSDIVETLDTYLKQISHIVAHNANFDISILKSELYRLGMHSIIAEITSKRILCTMKHTKMIVKAKNNYGIKYPSLAELYSFVFNSKIENAHNSKYDTINLHKIVKSMYDSDQLKFNEIICYTPQVQKMIEETDTIVKHDVQQPKVVSIIPDTIKFTKFRMNELRQKCKEKGIKGYSRMNKQAIINKLRKVTTI